VAAPSVSALLRDAALPLWEEQLRHPFVRGIADGSLPESTFRNWVVQDWLYLIDFARVLAYGAAKADRLQSMAWFASVLDLTLNAEMRLHREYAARFDIDEAGLAAAEAWPTTRAYTDFLVRTAAHGSIEELLAALLPCAWGYVHVGQALAREPRPADARYADWIEQYASDEFADAAAWLRDELDRLVPSADDPRIPRLRELFVVSSRYELDFWEMCWRGEPVRT